MPKQNDEFYVELLQLIERGETKQVVQQILDQSDKYTQIYTVSRLYKGIYPHIDRAIEINIYADLESVLKTIGANAFLFDLALSIIDQADLNLDIRSDLQHAVTLKRMLAHAFKEAIDLDYALSDELMEELDMARAILQTIIMTLQTVLQRV
jgi:hypothetical protein